MAFARTGDPNHARLPHWSPYSLERRPTMVFDTTSALVPNPLRQEREALERLPLYNPARGEGLLRSTPGHAVALNPLR